jgi:hypothetical protein
MPRKTKSKLRRRVLWAALAAMAFLFGGAVAALLAFQHIPRWYHPVFVGASDLSRVRNSLPNTYQRLQEQAIGGVPFEFALTDRAVTEWTVARGELYPEAEGWLPPMLQDPVVVFDGDACILAARVEYAGWKTIAAVHLVAGVTNEAITVRVARVSVGSLPVPLSMLEKPLAKLLNDPRLDVEAMPDPLADIILALRAAGPKVLADKGVSVRNLFELRSAHRLVKIRGLSARGGTLTATLESR